MSIIHHYAQNTSNLSMHNMHNIFPASTSSRLNFKCHSPFRSSRCSLLPSLNGELDEKPWSIQSFTGISRGVVGGLLYSFLHLFSHFEWFESIDELMNYQFFSTLSLFIQHTIHLVGLSRFRLHLGSKRRMNLGHFLWQPTSALSCDLWLTATSGLMFP